MHQILDGDGPGYKTPSAIKLSKIEISQRYWTGLEHPFYARHAIILLKSHLTSEHFFSLMSQGRHHV